MLSGESYRARRKVAAKIFTKHNLTLQASASEHLISQGIQLDVDSFEKFFNAIARTCAQQLGDRKVVDFDAIEHAAKTIYSEGSVLPLTSTSAISTEEVGARLDIVNAFDVPNYSFSTGNTAAERSKNSSSSPLGTATAKAALCRERYELIRQRLLRNELFRPDSSFSNRNVSDEQDNVFKITDIKHLLTKESGSFFTMGMLTRLQDGLYHLEDPHAEIGLEFQTGVSQTPGLFTENCMVVVEGTLTPRHTLRINAIGMPAAESRATSDKVFKHVELFGAPKSIHTQTELLALERTLDDVSFVILSDVWLDQPKVLSKLRTLFEGFTSSHAVLPLAFILMGNFSSYPYILNGQRSASYRDGFNQLADLISDFPQLRTCHFIFVPGPSDPWSSDVLPREGIPAQFTQKIRQKVPRALFPSNPCRIKYFTQEFVIFREDLLNKLRRNCILPPDEVQEPDTKQHLIRTVIDQAHLSPLPLEVRPIDWNNDASMRLYPLPHSLILADRFDHYATEYMDCKCVNPGSFPNSDWTFLVYHAATRDYQISRVP